MLPLPSEMAGQTSPMPRYRPNNTYRTSTPEEWLTTKEIATALDINPNSPKRIKTAGLFVEGTHFRKMNPTKQRSRLRWHLDRTRAGPWSSDCAASGC